MNANSKLQTALHALAAKGYKVEIRGSLLIFRHDRARVTYDVETELHKGTKIKTGKGLKTLLTKLK